MIKYAKIGHIRRIIYEMILLMLLTIKTAGTGINSLILMSIITPIAIDKDIVINFSTFLGLKYVKTMPKQVDKPATEDNNKAYLKFIIIITN